MKPRSACRFPLSWLFAFGEAPGMEAWSFSVACSAPTIGSSPVITGFSAASAPATAGRSPVTLGRGPSTESPFRPLSLRSAGFALRLAAFRLLSFRMVRRFVAFFRSLELLGGLFGADDRQLTGDHRLLRRIGPGDCRKVSGHARQGPEHRVPVPALVAAFGGVRAALGGVPSVVVSHGASLRRVLPIC